MTSMVMNTDGQKKIGRFLKKGSKLLSHMSMVKFDFDEIANPLPVGFDNPDRSIINTRFHDPQEIASGVKTPPSMDAQLDDPAKPRRGIIFPSDFTQDWYNERSNKKKKKVSADEDDDDFNVNVAGQTAHTSSSSVAHLNSSSNGNLSDVLESADFDKQSTEPPIRSVQAVPPESVRNNDSTTVGKVLSEQDLSVAISKAFTPPAPSAQRQESAQKAADSFTPFPTASEGTPVAAEDQAIETWKAQQQLALENERLLEELKSQARSEGYQSGFREGEEKGLISGQKKAAQVFSKVEEIISEFEGLKSLVLDNVQKNFYELSQAIAEALLGREFSIRPEAYATMIQRIIKDTVTPNEFKVKMHPDTWQRVHDLGLPELSPHLMKDSSIPVGEFRVESALTVVDVSVKKLVQQLLEKADINLFDEKKAV